MIAGLFYGISLKIFIGEIYRINAGAVIILNRVERDGGREENAVMVV